MSNEVIERVARCHAAMSKPGPIDALRLIASGRVVIEVRADGNCYLDMMDGRKVRDPDHPESLMPIAGAWPLLTAGMIDQFGVITQAGRDCLVAAMHNAAKDTP